VASSFAYDALGRRVGQTASSLTTQYVYDGLNAAQEQFSSGGVADMLPGVGLDENFARTDSSGSYAMLADLLGSTIGLVNSSGALGTQYQYGPFGQTTMTGASSTNPLQYTGREMDATGLYFLRARYYNPIAQRFVSPDPIGLSGGQVNLYAYVFNQPMDWTDPLGLISSGVSVGCEDCLTIVPAVGQTPTSGILQVQLSQNTLELPQAKQAPTASATPAMNWQYLSWEETAAYMKQSGLNNDEVETQLESQGCPQAIAVNIVQGFSSFRHPLGSSIQSTPYGWRGGTPAIPTPVPPIP